VVSGSLKRTLPPTEHALSLGKVQLAYDIDATLDGSGNGATVSINFDYAFYRFAVFLICSEVKGGLDALEYEYLTLGLYLPGALGIEIIE
jgi:hypothetical protein